VDIVKTDNAQQTLDVARAIDAADADCVYVVGGDGTLAKVSARTHAHHVDCNFVRLTQVLTGMLLDDNNNSRMAAVPVGVFPGGVRMNTLHHLSPGTTTCARAFYHPSQTRRQQSLPTDTHATHTCAGSSVKAPWHSSVTCIKKV
jgi:hypothetical protein